MADNVGTVSATLELDTRKASQQWRRFQGELARSNRNVNGLGTISKDARQFEAALGAATNRVTAFAAAAGVFTVLSKSVSAFVRSIVEVDGALARINVNLNETGQGIKQFSSNLFNVARQTGQTFEVTAKAAEELARQGLSAEETTKRLKDSLMLARIAGIDSADAVQTLTAAINSFNQSALTSTEIVNKFAAVDTNFAVSSKDLTEAISRVGSTAQSAGVGLDQLIGLVTSLQQTTARGGATIGNGLKTIFTRLQAAPETVSALESVGVSIKDTNGQLRSAIDILRDYGAARKQVGEAERQALDRTVAGTFQINTLKAALADLTRQNSVYDSALRTSAGATDEAIRKNEQLNQTLSSLINQTAVSAKQLFSAIGNQSIGPALKELLGGVESLRKYLSGETGSEIGKGLGEGILKGITNVLSGPVLIGLVSTLALALRKVGATLLEDTKALFAINNASNARVRIQERINYLLANATETELAQYRAATSVLAAKQAILRIQERIASLEVTGSPLTNSLITKGILGNSTSRGLRAGVIPSFADPVASAISREIGAGVPASSIYVAKDSRVAGPSNPAGLLVANTRDEPMGGFQGVNRAISQGINPKTHGTIPNFAPIIRGQLRTSTGQFVSQADVSALNNLFDSLKGLDRNRIRQTAQEIKALSVGMNEASRRIVSARLASAYSAAARQEGKIISSETRYAPYITPDGGNGIDYSRAVMDRNMARSRGSMRTPNRGMFGPAYPINPALQQQLAEQADIDAAQRVEERFARSQVRRRRMAAELVKRRDRNFGRAQLAGIGLSFAGGLVPEGQGGTAQGMLGGFAQGASYGGGIGGLFGPIGLAVGGLGGGLIGAFSKLKKSVEELSTEIDEGVNKRQKELEGLDRYIQAQTELNEAIERGADPATLKRFATRVAEARGGLTKTTAEIGGIVDVDERNRRIEQEKQKAAREEARGEVTKGLLAGKVSRGTVRQTFGGDFVSSLTPDQIAAINRAASGTFDVGPATMNAKTGATNLPQVAKAQQDYKKSLEELTPVLQEIVDISKLTPGNLAGFANTLRKAILESRQIQSIVASGTKAPGILPLNKGAFLNAPDVGTYRQAGMAPRTFGLTPVQRAQSQYSLLNEIASSSGMGPEILETIPGYKQSRALLQQENVLRGAISFIQGASPGATGLTGLNNQPNAGGIQAALRGLSKVSGTTGQNAQQILALVERARATVDGAGYKAPPELLNGLMVGTKYSTYAGDSTKSQDPRIQLNRNGMISYSDFQQRSAEKLRAQQYIGSFSPAQGGDSSVRINLDAIKEAQAAADKTIQAANQITLRTALQIDGTIKVTSDVLSGDKLRSLSDELTAAVGKRFEADVREINNRISLLEYKAANAEGKPLPPSMNGKSSPFIQPMLTDNGS